VYVHKGNNFSMVLQVHKVFRSWHMESEPMWNTWNRSRQNESSEALLLYRILRYFKVGLQLSLITTEVKVHTSVLTMSTWNVLVTLPTDMDIWTWRLWKKRHKGPPCVLAFAYDILSIGMKVFQEIKFSITSETDWCCDICLSTKRQACNNAWWTIGEYNAKQLRAVCLWSDQPQSQLNAIPGSQKSLTEQATFVDSMGLLDPPWWIWWHKSMKYC
jgi:hypothetical protein